MALDVRLHSAEMAAMLRSDPVQAAVMAEAEKVAERARSAGILVEGEPGDVVLPVEVTDARTSRARALVSLNHPAGLATEAKHRILGGALG